ncbi:MAG: hypothetical protein KJ058_12615 [Thermoanaerobaculia bacterium]|nr:hypothetical protein [Thermoanaerobaculia bacterium]
MTDPTPHPQFDWSVDTLIAEAVVRTLRADTVLSAYFGSGMGILPIESEVFFDAGVLSLRAPALLVSLAGLDEVRIGSAQYAELETVVDLWLVTAAETSTTSQQWLRARIVNYIKALLQTEQGTLRDSDGNRITEALTRFQRTLLSGRLRGTNLVLTQLRCLYRSDIDQSTREFED